MSEHILENAEAMLDACRGEYERAGCRDIAQAIKGLDVKSESSARVALLTIRDYQPPAILLGMKCLTVQAVAKAVNSYRALKLAS